MSYGFYKVTRNGDLTPFGAAAPMTTPTILPTKTSTYTLLPVRTAAAAPVIVPTITTTTYTPPISPVASSCPPCVCPECVQNPCICPDCPAPSPCVCPECVQNPCVCPDCNGGTYLTESTPVPWYKRTSTYVGGGLVGLTVIAAIVVLKRAKK